MGGELVAVADAHENEFVETCAGMGSVSVDLPDCLDFEFREARVTAPWMAASYDKPQWQRTASPLRTHANGSPFHCSSSRAGSGSASSCGGTIAPTSRSDHEAATELDTFDTRPVRLRTGLSATCSGAQVSSFFACQYEGTAGIRSQRGRMACRSFRAWALHCY